MFLLQSILVLLLALQSGPPASQDEVKDALAHAEALYFEARFKDSIQLLTRVDETLRSKPDRTPERISAKLQLALAHVGLNDNAQAKLYLRELFALDADYALDAQQFSPKVLALAVDAKAEQNDIRCQTIRDDARKKLEANQAAALLDLITTMRPKCGELAAFEPETAALLYKSGVEAYRRGEYSTALQQLRATLKLSPKHELAPQYLELAMSKLQVAEDRLLLEWQRSFAAQDYRQAAASYRQMNGQALNQVRSEYRKSLTELVESGNHACSNGDAAMLNAVRNQITSLIPEPSFGEDIRSQLTSCVKAGCVQMAPQLALTRLKTRVNPEIPPEVRGFIRSAPVTVRVKTKIDESGNASVIETQGGNLMLNNAVRNAVERWKFAPAVDMHGPRCVETEIPIVIGP